MKSLKIAFALLVGVLAAGCYNDFDTPGPRKLYTDDDMTQMGLQQVSIKTVKGWFTEAFGGISGTGTNNNGWENTKTLKFGELTPDEMQFISLKGRPDASNKYIRGKVISSDRQGNIYKSLYIYDGTAAIELKLYNGLYLDYLLDLCAPRRPLSGQLPHDAFDRRGSLGRHQYGRHAQVLRQLEPRQPEGRQTERFPRGLCEAGGFGHL